MLRQLSSVVPSKGHLPRMSGQLRLSVNDKSDNEMIPGAVQGSSGIYLTAEENPRKPQLGDSLIKAVQPAIFSKGIPYLQTRSVVSHSMSEREREGRRERKVSGYLESRLQ